MSEDTYNGWANRETWAVALHINNDQGWQESVREALRTAQPEMVCAVCGEGIRKDGNGYRHTHADEDTYCGTGDGATATPVSKPLEAWEAGLVIRENVEDTLDLLWDAHSDELRNILTDLGSLWRVDWRELGASFLEDLGDDDA